MQVQEENQLLQSEVDRMQETIELLQADLAVAKDEVERWAARNRELEDRLEHIRMAADGRKRRLVDPLGEAKRSPAEHERLVRDLGEMQLVKLNRNAHKLHWRSQSLQFLLGRLHEELIELRGAVAASGMPEDVLEEAADVANVAAMVADRYAAGSSS